MLFIRLKKYLSNYLLPVILTLFLIYISYYTFIGDTGLAKNTTLKEELNKTTGQLMKTVSRR